MSYDLIFWREVSARLDTPGEVYSRVLEDEAVEGLAELPIDRIKRRFTEAFRGINDEGAQMAWEGESSGFIVSWPPDPVIALIVNCGWGLLESPDLMNRIIELAQEFGCALFDPQTGKRYSQPENSQAAD